MKETKQDTGLAQLHCAGCGVLLQTENKDKSGFIPLSARGKEVLTCQRCFRITHYNEVTPVELSDDDFLRVLHKIGESKGLVVKIVDMFDFNGSWISGLPRFVGENPILLVGNKVDLLPKSLNLNRMKNWMKQSAKELGLKPVDVLLCSAAKGIGIPELMEAMDEYRNGQDVYIVGATNVGKSTFINRILKNVGAKDEQLVTTSRFPGTTLDMIDIPLDDGKSMFDTPGIINRHQMAHYVTEEELKIISPIKPIKSMVFQLNDQQTLFFGGLSRLDFVKGEHQPFVCYMSNLLTIHRTKLERADEVYEKHLGEMLSPPGPAQLESWPKLVKHSFKVTNEPTDIVFSGLGWVTLKGTGAIIDAYAPKGVAVTIRRALI
jgi:ribosome biogenesis GTPase YqeH